MLTGAVPVATLLLISSESLRWVGWRFHSLWQHDNMQTLARDGLLGIVFAWGITDGIHSGSKLFIQVLTLCTWSSITIQGVQHESSFQSTLLIHRVSTSLQVMEGRVKAGRIDCAKHRICSQAYIQGYPTLRFYRGATKTIPKQVNYRVCETSCWTLLPTINRSHWLPYTSLASLTILVQISRDDFSALYVCN